MIAISALLIDSHWNEIPDGTRVWVSMTGGSPGWYLLADDRHVPCYGGYGFGLRQFAYHRALGNYLSVPCYLTLHDLHLVKSS